MLTAGVDVGLEARAANEEGASAAKDEYDGSAADVPPLVASLPNEDEETEEDDTEEGVEEKEEKEEVDPNEPTTAAAARALPLNGKGGLIDVDEYEALYCGLSLPEATSSQVEPVVFANGLRGGLSLPVTTSSHVEPVAFANGLLRGTILNQKSKY